MNIQKLIELRKQHGYTQEKLAELLETDRSHLNQIEKGKRNPSVALISRMSKLFNVPMKDFF